MFVQPTTYLLLAVFKSLAELTICAINVVVTMLIYFLIDGVASGAIDISTYRYDNLVPDLCDAVTEGTGADLPQNYDFMSQATRLDCVRVCEDDRCVISKPDQYDAGVCRWVESRSFGFPLKLLGRV